MTDFVRASGLANFSTFAASQGLNAEILLLQAGLPRDLEAHPDSLISYRKVLNLLDECELQSRNRLFALQYGLFQGLNVFGPLLYLIRNAKDVRAALVELGNYFHVHSGAAQVRLEEQSEHTIISYTITDPTIFGSRHGAELALGIGMPLMRTLLGKRWQPSAALLQHAPVAEPGQYRRLIGLIPSFNAPCNGWMFETSLLDTTLHAADPALHRLIQQHLDNIAQKAVQQLPELVQQLIRSFMPDGRATIEQIASHLNISTRTLQRQLEDEGTTFQDLLSSTRQAMASRYLLDSNISISQLADLLGYSDQSAFSRAFQRWHGQSPREWRKQQTTDDLV
ncbi:AraC family transcriptional regulator ligand-binding domain-containing protein [Pseudomonas kielensis]|jgi:AraC-like DNA-binding protein|uniref:AraC-like transcriptional regulator QhpR n=1 Tax=Pseudomonas TaxID=286 RepID=UPI00141362BF|nr:MULTISPECIES: AraC family transcriptional regulator ligand-binding domain-containing protein [Pseudomonas]NBB35153.1 helix-turn-helix domain-containing protein [Pseudomonas sp. BC115LW]WKL52767.1 AraC family transcriptional regulator ligand-binding domain-containing protein [Pseudomonas kielensis]